jgi:AcrR family transcriptional regulator
MPEQCSEFNRCSCIFRHVNSLSERPEGRRARQRRELLAEIESEARRLLESHGAAGVSMRAIARAVGMGPASLYTYFASLDDVFTMLLLSSYRRLADATASAATAFPADPPADRAVFGILAHRRWALDHPNEFNLVFTDMLPGYAAPPGGPTVDAQIEVFQPIVTALAEVLPAEPTVTVQEMLVLVWTAFHGVVALEVNHHLDWTDDSAAIHERAVRNALASVGLPEPSDDVRRRFERWRRRHTLH